MSLPTKAFSQLLKPQLNRGSFFVKYLVCLQEFDHQAPDHNVEQFAQFRQEHDLTADQVMGLADILGGDIATVQRLSGPAFGEYVSHLDYKFRNFGVATGEDVEASWRNLSEQYTGFAQAMTPSARRVEILRDLAYIFIKNGRVNGSDFSTVSDSQVDQIVSKLNQYEERLLAGVEDAEERAAYEYVFDSIEQDITTNPTFFLVDTVSWIDTTLRYGGESGILLHREPEAYVSRIETTTDITEQVVQERQEGYLAEVTERNQKALRRYVADEEGRTLLVDNEDSIEPVSRLPRYGLNTLAGLWGVLTLTGTAPLGVLVGGPVLGYYAHDMLKKFERATEVDYVSHIYSRETETGTVLDFVIQQNGQVVSTLEDVPSSEVRMTNDPATEVTFGGKTTTLAEARQAGLSGVMDVVTVQGTSYFLPSNYAADATRLREVGIAQ